MPGTNTLLGVGLAVVVALAIVLIVLLSGGGGGAGDVTAADVTKVRQAMTAAGCTFVERPAEAAAHVSRDDRHSYASFPPTSGAHDGSTTTIWGNYRTPVDPRQAVHNLEHGGVVVWYGPDISAEDRERIDAFYDDSPNGVVVTPIPDPFEGVTYPKHEPLGSRVAISVWTAPERTPDQGTTYVSVCPSVDVAAFGTFRDTFRGKGRERVPTSSQTPGVVG